MDFIRIENRDTWLIKEIPNYHPDDPRHTQLWREYKRKCIEGVWEKDFNGYRFMPGNLWFYINFGIILNADEKKKARFKIKPHLRDLEWERAYMCAEAFGFSGFSDDEYVTCYSFAKDAKKEDYKSFPEECFKGDGTLKEYKNPRDYLRSLHSQPLGRPLYHNNAKNTMEFGARGGGKDLYEKTIIYTKNGPIEIKDINIGDKIYGANGKLTTVVQKRNFTNQLQYLVEFADGRKIECGKGHLWTLINNSGKKITCELNDIKDNYLGYKRPNGKQDLKYFVQQCKPIQYENKNLIIDPYYLGLWLGDGNSHNTGITTKDKEILDYVTKYAESLNLHIQINQNKSKSCPTYNLNIKGGNRFKTNPLKNLLKELNLLHNKHIPNIYKYSSIEQRLELVKGLMDSDGFCDNRHIQFSNKNEILINDLKSILESLGIKVTKSLKIINNQTYFLLNIKSLIPIFKLSRKQRYWQETTEFQKKYKESKLSKNGIIKITPTEIKPSVCIAVDNEDSLFVAGDYIVTHNSYWYSLGINLYEILFDGAKEYTEETRKNPATTEVLIGAALSSKSNEFCAKIELAMNELATNPLLGCWGKPGDEDYQPSPFYKDMKGSLKPNNAENPYIHKYEKKVNGRWVSGFGTGSKILHNTFTQENPEAAAGTRPVRITIEEVGLVPNVLTVHASNDACQRVDKTKFGSTHYLGTAGNIEKVIESRILFTEPDGYDIVSYDDIWEHTGKIGFFLPAYYTNNSFRDENGNTDIESAKAFYEKRRENAKKVSSQKYDGELMNYPLVPSEMFLGREGKILPITELKEREKQLLLHNNYKKIGTSIDIYFDSSKLTGVDYKILPNIEPIYNYPHKRDENTEGCIVMYEAPIEINGKVPNDMYDLIGFDPYISENIDEGGSLGAVYVMKNPKYESLGYGGNEIVCGYVGKHPHGRSRFLENIEKIIMMYGNPLQGLWFEGNRGDYVKGYFEKKYKLHHLCLRPQIEKGVRVLKRPVAEYGWLTGNRISKIQLLDMLAEWLKEETVVNGIKKRNYERIPDIALIKEMIAFDLDKGNFDRCFSKNTLVTTNKGLKTIDNIKKGDLVLTKSLEYHPVELLHKNKAEILNVYVEGDSSPIETTANHPFYTRNNKTVKHNTRYKLLNERYKNAKDLTSEDFVLLPKRKLIEEYYTNDELYLLGWFIGDGNINSSNNLIKFIFSIRELEQAKKVKKILDSMDNTNITRIKKKENWYSLEKFSKPIKTWLNENCGMTTHKQINDKVFNSKNNFYFLLGFLEAEGHKTKAKGDIQVSNTNLLTMKLVRQMLLDNKIYNSIRLIKNKHGNKDQLAINIPYTYTQSFNCSSKFNFEPRYKRTRIKLNAIEKEEGFYCRVKKVEKTNRIEDTYNLSVLDDNTYFANNVLVHNCMALVGCIVGLREKVNQYEQQVMYKNNPLSLLANNNSLFDRHNYKLKKKKKLLLENNSLFK